MSKSNRTFRLEPEQDSQLSQMQINVSELVRELVSKFLESKVCPVCHNKIHIKKELKTKNSKDTV